MEVQQITSDVVTGDALASDAPARNKSGAPLGNVNAMRHGLRSSRPAAGMADLQRDANRFRRAVEAEFIALHRRNPNTREAAIILAAMLNYLHCRRVGRWAAGEHDNLSHADRLAYSEAEARAATAVAVTLEKLGLPGGPAESPLSQFLQRGR